MVVLCPMASNFICQSVTTEDLTKKLWGILRKTSEKWHELPGMVLGIAQKAYF